MQKLAVNKNAQCVGCRQCEMACSLQHEGLFAPWHSRIKVKRDERIVLSEPVICRHCDDAPCAAACPVNAIVQSDTTGAFYVDQVECIGCMQCLEACPYDALTYHNQKGVALKCDLCGGRPACVEVCPANVLKLEVR